jgi:hypothetical protein
MSAVWLSQLRTFDYGIFCRSTDLNRGEQA